MPRKNEPTLQQAFSGLKADYAAMTPSRFRRTRTGVNPLGSGADYHFRNETAFLKMREYVRAMDRDDAILGATVDKATQQHIQDGFRLDPNTPDKAINEELWGRWDSWSSDPDQCDIAGELEFADMEFFALRHQFIDGDLFALPTVNGALQLIEADQCRTPTNSRKNIVLGIELDEQRRRKTFYFTKRAIDPFSSVERVSDTNAISARDADGFRQVFQIYHAKRVSQTRGITAFHACFDIAGMWEDANFALLVKQQIVACFGAFLKRTDSYQSNMRMGERSTQQLDDGNTATIEGLTPGMILRGAKGEELQTISPNIPSAESMQHMRMLLQIIGVNLGMPLILILLDSSETNFSGWRGAMDMARLGFRSNQHQLIRRFHKPVYRWKVRQWMSEDPVLARALEKLGDKALECKWHPPSWPYIQPLDDANADVTRQNNLLTSPRRIHAEAGAEFDEVAAEAIADNVMVISQAIEGAQTIEQKYGIKVDWREVLRPFKDQKTAPAADGSQPADGADPNDPNAPPPNGNPGTTEG